MATKREQIVVDIGGDAAKLLKEFNVSKQAATTWARETAKEITQGRLPEAWRNYTADIKKATEATKATNTESGSLISTLGKVGVAAIGFKVFKKAASEAVTALREVAAELASINKEWDASPFLKKQREGQLNSLSGNDRNSIIAGNAQSTGLWNTIKDKLAVGAGNATLLADIIKLKATGETATGFGLSWAAAADRAVRNQTELVIGIKAAAKEAELAAQKKAQEEADAKQRQELDALRTKNFAAYEEKMRQRNLEQTKQQNELLERQAKLKQMIATSRRDYSAKLGQNIHDEFLPTLDELATTGRFTSEAQRLQFLQSDTKDAILWNDQASLTRNIDEIQSIRDKLTKAGVFKDPNQALINEFKMLTDPIRTTGKLPVQVELDK